MNVVCNKTDMSVSHKEILTEEQYKKQRLTRFSTDLLNYPHYWKITCKVQLVNL